MHESLKVYLKDSFVGWLSHETVGDEYSFEYNKDYLANPVEGALSFALPLTGGKFDSTLRNNQVQETLGQEIQRNSYDPSNHADSSAEVRKVRDDLAMTYKKGCNYVEDLRY